ncbi:hypothetical protein AT291_05645 [Porphyromonas gingivalis]|nr:hypothetical protein AT291_05645 [Porphyromonas gingivalis]PDP45743.1 hypothetical protein CLI82_09235 [Porphyromonas gingivalis]
MQEKAAVLDPSPISALFCKGKIMLLYSQFYTENHVFSLRINTCFWGFAGVFMGDRNLFFCGCRIARFFSFAFLSLQGDIERCFRFEKIETRQTKKTWLRKFFVLARE